MLTEGTHLESLGRGTGLDSTTLPNLIEAIGKPHFHNLVLGVLHDCLGAEHCAIFGLRGERPTRVGAASVDGTDTARQQVDFYLEHFWRFDPMLQSARILDNQSPARVLRLEIDKQPPTRKQDHDNQQTHKSERVL